MTTSHTAPASVPPPIAVLVLACGLVVGWACGTCGGGGIASDGSTCPDCGGHGHT